MKKLLAPILALLPGLAWGQGAILQNGSVAPRDLPVFIQDRKAESASKLLADTGYGTNPFNITDSNGCGVTLNSTITSSASNSKLCLGHNSSGDGIISYTGTGSIQAVINGTAYPFHGNGNGNVIGPISSVAGDLALFNSTTGTLLAGTGGKFFVNSFGLAAGYGGGMGDNTNIFNLKHVYSSSPGGAAPSAIYGVTDYRAVVGGTDIDNPAGLYGATVLDAPNTFGGEPSGLKGNIYTAPQLTAAISVAGSGYTNGDTVSITGGTCTALLNTAPQFTLTVSGGTVTAATFVSTGTGGCNPYPANPVSVSGGTGTGLRLNLTNSAMTVSLMAGVVGRSRHVATGTVTASYGLLADGGYNVGGGTVTNQVGVGIIPPYDTNYSNAYAILLPSSGCSPTCWTNTIATQNDPVNISTGGSSNAITLSPSGSSTIRSGSGANVNLAPGGTGVVNINPNSSTLPISGSAYAAGLYPYMLSNGSANIDAGSSGSNTTSLTLRTYNNGTYNTGVLINSAGGVGLAGGSVSALTGGEIGLPKIAASGSAPGASTGKLAVVAGTNAGSCKLIMYAGTSSTPVTVIDNVGTGC